MAKRNEKLGANCPPISEDEKPKSWRDKIKAKEKNIAEAEELIRVAMSDFPRIYQELLSVRQSEELSCEVIQRVCEVVYILSVIQSTESLYQLSLPAAGAVRAWALQIQNRVGVLEAEREGRRSETQ